MKSFRYQLLVMSCMAIAWSVFELGIRIYSFITSLGSDNANKSEWLINTAQESVLFLLVILTGLLGIKAIKKAKLLPFTVIMGIVCLLANVVLFFTINVPFNIVIIVASFMITYNAFQLQKMNKSEQ